MADKQPELQRVAISLSKPSRWAALVLGLASMVTGGLASFKADLEAPPVAFLGVGLILGLVGLAGVMPTRLKVGESEAEFLEHRVGQALQRGVAEQRSGRNASPEAREAVAALVNRVADVAPEVAAPAADYLMYEDLVNRRLVQALQEEDRLYDRFGSREWMQIAPFAEGRYSYGELAHEYDDFVMVAGPESVGIIVTNVPLSKSAERSLASGAFTGLYHAMVKSERDKPVLRAAVERALTGPTLPFTAPDNLFSAQD